MSSSLLIRKGKVNVCSFIGCSIFYDIFHSYASWEKFTPITEQMIIEGIAEIKEKINKIKDKIAFYSFNIIGLSAEEFNERYEYIEFLKRTLAEMQDALGQANLLENMLYESDSFETNESTIEWGIF